MKTRGLSNLRLKVIGLVLVALSALGTAFVRKGMPADLSQADFIQLTWSVVLEAISWIGFPIYAWLTVNGYLHTSNVMKYGVRLFVLGLVAEVPYDLATAGKALDMSSQNPVLGLLVILIVLYALDRFSAGPRGRSIGMSVFMVIAGVLWLVGLNIGLRLGLMPGGVVMLVFALIFRYLSHRDNIMNLVGCVVGALAGIFPAFGLAVLHFRNGEQGSASPAVKWFFYVAYPVVLLVIGLAGLWA